MNIVVNDSGLSATPSYTSRCFLLNNPTMRESHLEKKLKQLGLTADVGRTPKKLTFKLFFPRPPYMGVEYHAARQKDGYNFVGLILGHGGSTLQRIQKQSGTKIEIHDEHGNLNGAHPGSSTAALHAYILADSQAKLEKAVDMIKDILQPTNSQYLPFETIAGGSAQLKPIAVDTMDLYEYDSSKSSSEQDVPYITKPNGHISWDDCKALDDSGSTKSTTPKQLNEQVLGYSKPVENVWSKNSPWSRSSASSTDGYTPQVLPVSNSLFAGLSNGQQSPFAGSSSAVSDGMLAGSENSSAENLNLGWTSWNNSRNFLYDSLAQATQGTMSQKLADVSLKTSNSNSGYTSFNTTPTVSFEENLSDLLLDGHGLRNVLNCQMTTPLFKEAGYQQNTTASFCAPRDYGTLYAKTAHFGSFQQECDTNVEELVEMLKVPLS